MSGVPEGGSRWTSRAPTTGSEYDKAWERLEASGENPHGEADFVESLGAQTVLDAGCGTGRVAIELARRGLEVVGVDLDRRMLGTAREKAPELEWYEADLAALELRGGSGSIRRFDAVVMAGNVMIFVAPGTEGAVIQRLADHLAPGGSLVAGFQLRRGGLSLATYDDLAADSGLILDSRYSTWSRDPFSPPADYAVSVHVNPSENASG